ncbi:MAG: RdgB/HAM1 family non-canonical purine NTP pyrophosphatase [Alphaproteobacteria bacterium]|nr:RdgB/HAM1 family non-canonical purine NTP pyrophosphatase [Alphaproteobacteria bacterium]
MSENPVRRVSRLVVASHNQGKVDEIAALLGPLGIAPVSAGSLGLSEPEETEDTFVGNAVLKADAAAAESGEACLADDSGLAVSALGGAPGIYSARWAGEPRDFNRAMQRVWDEVQAAGAQDLRARFICVLALKRPGEAAEIFEGAVEGVLTWPPRGDRGFGYDPMFTPDGYAITFGEMEPDEKHRISHRARAFEKLVASLK